MEPYYADDLVTLYHGDCLDVLRTMPDGSVDAVVTDPPYGLEFMGKAWDSFGRDRTSAPNYYTAGAPFQRWCEAWSRECLRVLKPGGHMLAFGGTRTWHRLACAVEDAGFEVRDSIAWIHGQGFPKSLDVSKAIDKAAGAERPILGHEARDYTQNRVSDKPSDSELFGERARLRPITEAQTPDAERWQGWGTAMKPAFEPVVCARKPLSGTVAANVLAHGTGALNIDGCRTETTDNLNGGAYTEGRKGRAMAPGGEARNVADLGAYTPPAGRWPANVVLDESQAEALDAQSGAVGGNSTGPGGTARRAYTADRSVPIVPDGSTPFDYGDLGGASRFFYVAKADASERVRVNGTAHPTVKPLALMRWLVRLVTPPGGTVLEPFAGSGTTVEACLLEGFQCIAIEREADYLPLVVQRINRRRDPVAAVKATGDDGGLFDLLGEETA